MRYQRKFDRRRLASIVIILAAIGLIWIISARLGLNPHELHSRVGTLDPALVFVAMAILPIFGFSIGVVYVVAGVKFGTGLGLVLVAVATAIHLVGSYWIARSFLRERVEAMLARRRHHLPKLPQGEEASVVLLAALVPGLPYAARNYLLGLAGIRFRTCFFICLPIYTIRSSIALLFGEFSGTFTLNKAGLLVFIFCVKVAICAYVIKRLRDQWPKSQESETDFAAAHEKDWSKPRN